MTFSILGLVNSFCLLVAAISTIFFKEMRDFSEILPLTSIPCCSLLNAALVFLVPIYVFNEKAQACL